MYGNVILRTVGLRFTRPDPVLSMLVVVGRGGGGLRSDEGSRGPRRPPVGPGD